MDSVAPREAALAIDAVVEDTFDARDTTVDAVADAIVCETGVRAGGHCYFLLDEPSSWYDARDACIERDSHLATITAADELEVVKALGEGDRWLGLRRDGDAGVFGWITGEPFSLDGFKPGEPNGTGSCAKIVEGGEWWDHSCLESLPALCERD